MKSVPFARLYRFVPSRDGMCYYCGAMPFEVDHCPPLHAAQHFLGTTVEFVIVPACHLCNSRLGPLVIPTLAARVAYLIRRWPRKCKAVAERWSKP